MDRFYSFIIPVFDRPDELAELLESFARQSLKTFEVVIVEDGSALKSDRLAESYMERLAIRYFDRPRSGPSIARNFGVSQSRGDYLVFVDSDCILPPEYLMIVDRHLDQVPLDFFGGPDRAAGDFNRVQKAISYAMTSFLTTGGIRGGKRQVDRFYPRSFNMGITRRAWDETGGFPVTTMHPGEDMVFSIELIRKGFRSGLIPEAFVYHKRRTRFSRFFKQVCGFGKTRLIISKVYPQTFKLFYIFPTFFIAGNLLLLFSSILLTVLFSSFLPLLLLAPLLVWAFILFADASCRNRSVLTGIESLWASLIQLTAYGTGFFTAWFKAAILGCDEYGVFTAGFYPDRPSVHSHNQ